MEYYQEEVLTHLLLSPWFKSEYCNLKIVFRGLHFEESNWQIAGYKFYFGGCILQIEFCRLDYKIASCWLHFADCISANCIFPDCILHFADYIL